MRKKNDEKYMDYAAKIASQISGMFDEESDNYIDHEELMRDGNLTHFFHALANAAPTVIYCQLTGKELNILEFNHIANNLCFKFGTKE